MADTPPAPSSGTSTPTSNAADQARIRKERREAKIRAGGSARLNKITGLGGGVQRDAPIQPKASHDDPEEVDISEHFYEPKTSVRPQAQNIFNAPGSQGAPSDDQLRQMMLGFDTPAPGSGGPQNNPFAGFPGMGGPGMGMPGMDGNAMPGEDDPMMKMLQQMMGGMGEGAGGMPTFPGMPDLAGPGAPQATSYAYIWRIVHAVFALGLGLYIAFTTTFTGTKLERERSAFKSTIMSAEDEMSAASIHFFWIFATVEVLLQSSRFFLEKGTVQHSGIMGMVMNFLPQPYKGWLTMASRYFSIWTTVSGDAMVCVFVLGACHWWRGS